MSIKAIITERGNGFPGVGSYVPGPDGELYRLVRYVGPVHTGRPGGGNYSYARVEPADWDDVDERDVFPCECAV